MASYSKKRLYVQPEKNDMKESKKEQRINAALMKRSCVSQTIAQGPYMSKMYQHQ